MVEKYSQVGLEHINVFSSIIDAPCTAGFTWGRLADFYGGEREWRVIDAGTRGRVGSHSYA